MKKIFIPLITLIAGALAGYYFGKSSCGSVDFLDKDNKAMLEKLYTDSGFVMNEGSHRMSDEMAKTLISEFQRNNTGALFPLLNLGKKHLNGYYIDRGPLDTILANKSFTGISVYFAKDSTAYANGRSGRIYTLVYMGAKQNINGQVTNGVTTPYLNAEKGEDGDGAYDYVKPCPDACGNFLEKKKK